MSGFRAPGPLGGAPAAFTSALSSFSYGLPAGGFRPPGALAGAFGGGGGGGGIGG